jgi:osmotically inducible lipoprotein OsmB
VRCRTEAAGGLAYPVPSIYNKELIMKNIKRIAATAAVLAATLGLSACANMSGQDKNTAIGAGVGAVAGSVLTGGSAVGTVGGAAVGGVIGNQVQKPPR